MIFILYFLLMISITECSHSSHRKSGNVLSGHTSTAERLFPYNLTSVSQADSYTPPQFVLIPGMEGDTRVLDPYDGRTNASTDDYTTGGNCSSTVSYNFTINTNTSEHQLFVTIKVNVSMFFPESLPVEINYTSTTTTTTISTTISTTTKTISPSLWTVFNASAWTVSYNDTNTTTAPNITEEEPVNYVHCDVIDAFAQLWQFKVLDTITVAIPSPEGVVQTSPMVYCSDGNSTILEPCWTPIYTCLDPYQHVFDDKYTRIQTPMLHYTNDAFELQANTTAINTCGDVTTFAWRILQIGDSQITNVFTCKKNNKKTIAIKANTFDSGLYAVFFEIQSFNSSSNETLFDERSMFLRMITPELVAYISGPSSVELPRNNAIRLDATLSHDPAAGLSSVDAIPIERSWTVISANSSGLNNGSDVDVCIKNFPDCGILYSTNTSLMRHYTTVSSTSYYLILHSDHIYNDVIFVVFTMKRGTRKSSALQVIKLVDSGYLISLTCIYNCFQNRVKKMSVGRIELHASVAVHRSFTITYTETVEVWNTVTDRFEPSGIAFDSVSFPEGKTLRFVITSTVTPPKRWSRISTAYNRVEYIRHVNYRPYGGHCSIDTFSGVSSMDMFTVRCTGWMDEGARLYQNSTEDSNPILRYMVVQKTSTFSQTLATSSEPKLKFAVMLGDDTKAYAATVVVKVMDFLGDAAEIVFNVTSLPPMDVTSVTADWRGALAVRTYVNSTTHVMDRKSTKIDHVISLVTAASSVLSAIPIPVKETDLPKSIDETPGVILDINLNEQDNGTDHLSFHEYYEASIDRSLDPATQEIQMGVQWITTRAYNVLKERVVSGDKASDQLYVTHLTECFNTVLNVREYVNDVTKNLAVVGLQVLTGTSSNLWSISTTSGTEERESAETQLIDMTGSTVNVVVPNDLNQARVVYDLATAYQQIDDMVVISGQNMSDAMQAATMSSSERAYTYLKLQMQLKADLEKTKELARSSAGSVMEITRSIMDTLELCESCTKTIGTGDLVQSLTLMNTSQLASTPLPVRSGSLTLNGINTNSNSNKTTVSVSHFNKNIFMYDSDLSSSYVTYGVIHADTTDTSVGDVTYEQTVDARQQELVHPLIHEEDASKFALHKFVYRSSQDDVCLEIMPADNSTVIGYDVFVRFSGPPTILEYDVQMTLTARTDWINCITSEQMGDHLGLTYVGIKILYGTPDPDSSSTSTTTTVPIASPTTGATTSSAPTFITSITTTAATSTTTAAPASIGIMGSGRKKRDTRNEGIRKTHHGSSVHQAVSSGEEAASTDTSKVVLRTIGTKPRPGRVPASGTASSAYSRMRLRRSKRSTSSLTTTTNVTSPGDAYYFSIMTSACLNWEESNQKWASDKCRLLWLPNENKVRCYCSNVEQLTFGTSFFLAPNSIDFSTAFLRFSPLNQAAVLGALAAVFILYVPILVWARKKDQQDIEKWGVVPLADNADYHSYVYVIQVFTGLRPGSGTDSRVAFVLSGSKRDSDVKELYDGVRKRIETGSVLQFLMTTHAPLGQLTHLRIWHDNSGQGSMASWYLSKVVVYDLKDRDCFTFRCENWISVDTVDEILERTLTATHGADRPAYEQRFMSQAKDRLADSHMWASVLYRPTYSDFTRAQRATCALMYVTVNMVANAMYFNPDADYETDPAFKIGPFRLSLRQLSVAFITAIITAPSTLAVSIIFRLSRRRVTVGGLTSQRGDITSPRDSRPGSATELLETRDSGRCCCIQGKSRDSNEYSVPVLYLDQQRGCFSLPWQFSILGWILAVGAIVTSAFFVVMYSMDWGKQKSEEWITTFLLSLLQSVLLVDPFLIIGMSMCFAIVLASVKYANFKDWNVKASMEEMVDRASVSGYAADVPQPPLMSTDLEHAKIERRTERRWRRTLVDLLVTMLFLWILCSITYSNREDHAFYMHKTITEMMTIDEKGQDVFKKIHTTQMFYTWLYDMALPMLFPEAYYNGDSLHWSMREYMEGLQYYRLGPPRLRQIRIESEKCNIPHIDTETCYRSYADWRTDEQDYCIGWTAPSCPTYENVYNFSSDAWKFRSLDAIKSVPIFGHLAPYGSDGYFADLDVNRNISVNVVDELYQTGWIDRKTRVVLLEFTVFCANVNSFVYNQFVLEFPATGGVLTSYSVIPTRVYQHVGPLGAYVFFCEIVGLIYVLFLALQVAIGIFYNRSACFKKRWLMFDILRLALCVTVIALYAIRHYISMTTIDKFKTNAKAFVDFHSIAFWNELLMIILGFSVFFGTIRILKALEGNKSIYIISTVFSKLASDLLWLTVVFFYVLVVFAVLGYLLFGSQLVSYVNINTSLSTLFVALIGKNRFSEMNESDPILAKVFFFLFTMSMSMFLFSMVLSSLCQCIVEVRRSIHIKQTKDVFLYAYKEFIASFTRDLNRYVPSRNRNSVTPFEDKDFQRRFHGEKNIESDEKRKQAKLAEHGGYTRLRESRGYTPSDEANRHKSFVECGWDRSFVKSARRRPFTDNDGCSSIGESDCHPFFVDSGKNESFGDNGRHTSFGEKGNHVALSESGKSVSFIENGRHSSVGGREKKTPFGEKRMHFALSEKVRYAPLGEKVKKRQNIPDHNKHKKDSFC